MTSRPGHLSLTSAVGKVIVHIKVTNLKDTFLKEAGVRPDQPRTLTVEALVDTGPRASTSNLP